MEIFLLQSLRRIKIELKRLTRDEDGNVYATWVLTPDQFGFLLHYAITDLIEKGVAEVHDISDEELATLKQQAENEQSLQLLESIDTKDLPQA
jgi:hypothetical protein